MRGGTGQLDGDAFGKLAVGYELDLERALGSQTPSVKAAIFLTLVRATAGEGAWSTYAEILLHLQGATVFQNEPSKDAMRVALSDLKRTLAGSRSQYRLDIRKMGRVSLFRLTRTPSFDATGFVNDQSTEPIWDLLRTVLRYWFGRSLTITDTSGQHLLETTIGITSPVCRFLYSDGCPPACAKYDRDMSWLAVQRLDTLRMNPREQYSLGARQFSVARCPAGFIALGVPWRPSVHLSTFTDAQQECKSADDQQLLTHLEKSCLVFHIGEAVVKELDQLNDEKPCEGESSDKWHKEVEGFLKTRWKWTLHPDEGGASRSDSPSPPGLSGFLAKQSVGPERSWDDVLEAAYEQVVLGWLTTRPPINRATRGEGDANASAEFRDAFGMRSDENWRDIQVHYKQQADALDESFVRDVFTVNGFINACAPIQEIVTRAANSALSAWLSNRPESRLLWNVLFPRKRTLARKARET